MSDVAKLREELNTRLNLGYNIIASGFHSPPNNDLVSTLPNLDSIIPAKALTTYIFFQHPLTAQQREFWGNKNVWIEPYSMGLGKYLRQSGASEVQFDNPASFSGVADLRPDAIEKAVEFTKNNSKRICVVKGLKGIGKDSFLSELESTGRLTNILRFDFNHGNEFWLSELCEILHLHNITTNPLHFSEDQKNALVVKIIDRLNRESFVNLVFKNADQLLDNKGHIQKNSLFITLLCRALLFLRKSINIRFWLLTQRKIDFTSLNLDDYVWEIRLNTLSEEQTMKVLYRYSLTQDAYANQHTEAAPLLQHGAEIQKLTGGHLGIIKIFTKYSEHLPIEDIASDPLLKLKFYKIKADYIRGWLNLTAEEEMVLNFVAVLQREAVFQSDELEVVESDAIKEFQPDPNPLINRLAERFILDVVYSKKIPSKTYQMSLLLREYFLENMPSEVEMFLKIKMQKYLLRRLEP